MSALEDYVKFAPYSYNWSQMTLTEQVEMHDLALKELSDLLSEIERLKAERVNLKEPLSRCFNLLVAMKIESEKLSLITEERAKAMATLKINLMGYVMNIWKNKNSFINDIETLTNILDKPPEEE